jgi:hypothetical protein
MSSAGANRSAIRQEHEPYWALSILSDIDAKSTRSVRENEGVGVNMNNRPKVRVHC